MAAIAPGEVLSVAHPVLHTFTATITPLGPLLADPFALAFQIFDIRDDDAAAVQVFPTTPGDRHAVNLVADRIGLGHFAAAWTVPSPLATGRYEIRWYLTQAEGDAERSWRRDFDVLPVVPSGWISDYALVADMRDEGASSDVKNRRIVEAIARASRLIETWTGRVFGPVYKAIKIDSLRSPLLLLEEPICAIEAVTFDEDPTPVDPELYRVYARHLSQGLLSPDDRDSPKIEFIRRTAWAGDVYPTAPLVRGFADLRGPRASRSQSIGLAGVFGYTDPEPGGSPVGVMPAPIRRAAILIALRDLPKAITEAADAFDARYGGRVVEMRTREQTIRFSPATAGEGSISGDAAVDEILAAYMRPLTGTGV